MSQRTEDAARRFVAHSIGHGISIAVAESLTGGWLASTIVGVPGTSQVFRGGVVVYQTAAKRDVLGVDAALLAEVGPIDAGVAAQMAERVRELFAIDGSSATIGLATTGVAGPSGQDGHPVGEVLVAVALAEGTRVEHFFFTGARDEIREQAVAAALELASTVLADRQARPDRGNRSPAG